MSSGITLYMHSFVFEISQLPRHGSPMLSRVTTRVVNLLFL
jgi:hypothetical protein